MKEGWANNPKPGDICEECGKALKVGERIRFTDDAFFIWHEDCHNKAMKRYERNCRKVAASK